MEIIQFVAEGLGDSSYLIASGGVAAVIDAQRDIRPFVSAAEARNLRIAFAFETHVHNDYLSGGRELAALGAQVVAPGTAKLQFPHLGLADGQTIELGGVTLQAIAAPGHTYEHMAYLALDERGEPHGAFTGGSLLMAAAGRSDLLGPDHTEKLLRLQWESAHRIQEALRPGSAIMPTHGAGSFCSSAGACAERMGPLSVELGRNPALASPNFEAFRAVQVASPAPIPGYYRYMSPMNQAGPGVWGSVPKAAALEPGMLDALAARGVHVIDARSRADFAAGHLPGTVSIEDDGSLLAYTGWVVPFNAPIALVTYDAAQAERLTIDLFRIGYEDVRGFLPYAAWASEGRPLSRVEAVSPRQVAETLASAGAPVIDVRFSSEQDDLPLPGALRRPIDQVHEWIADAPDGATIVCASGYRSSVAASLLQARGRTVRACLAGGVGDVLALG
ncbi:MAG: MBL fold metallo-hydrolase [Dehalococcoidia bacterium]|nr:MBL fold metallo-hydrolase [Dehalococcoidia bacterium]